MFTLKDIADKLNLLFYIGDKNKLKELMFFNKDEFHNFEGNKLGKPQFLKQVQSLYSDICINKLREDYFINRILIRANYNMVRDYHKRTYLYPNLEFKYEKSCEPKMKEYSTRFEMFDNIVLPIDSSFWNIYLPPNHFEDSSFVRLSDKNTTAIPGNLPNIKNRFIIDRHAIFFNKEPFNVKEQISRQ